MKKVFKNIRTFIKKYGLKISFFKFLLVIINPIVSIRTVYKLDLNSINWERFKEGKFSIAEMDLKDLDLISLEHKSELSGKRNNSLKRLISDPDSVCYKIMNNSGEICAYGCIKYRTKEYERMFKKIRNLNLDKNVYILRNYTFKKFRNQGIQSYAYYERFKILIEKGYKSAVVRIAKYNFASEYQCERMGFKKELIELHFHFFNLFPYSNFLTMKIKKPNSGV
jgi:hypothetical protein